MRRVDHMRYYVVEGIWLRDTLATVIDGGKISAACDPCMSSTRVLLRQLRIAAGTGFQWLSAKC